MFYKICRILNITLSSLLIIILVLAIFGAKTFPTEIIFAMITIFVIAGFFLAFNFICGKFLKHNSEQIPISKRLKNKGKILFVFNLICALAMLGIAIAAFSPIFNPSDKVTESYSPIYVSIFLIFTLGGISSIVNLFFFRALLRKNKTITSDFINSIGDNS